MPQPPTKEYKESFRLLVLDKLIFGGALLVVALCVQYAWHANELQLKRFDLAVSQVPRIISHDEDPRLRVMLFQSLAELGAVSPGVLASTTGKLVIDGIDPDLLIPSLRPHVLAHPGEFLDAIRPVVLAPHDAKDKWPEFRVWQSIFLDMATGSQASDLKLDDDILAQDGRFYTLAFLLAEDLLPDYDRAVQLATSELPAAQLIGRMFIVAKRWISIQELFGRAVPTSIDASEDFVTRRLSRSTNTATQNALLEQELDVLIDSVRIFGSMLQGPIAFPLTDLFVNSERHRPKAYRVLASMFDCGADAKTILAANAKALAELHSMQDQSTKPLWLYEHRHQIWMLAALGLAPDLGHLVESLSPRWNTPPWQDEPCAQRAKDAEARELSLRGSPTPVLQTIRYPI